MRATPFAAAQRGRVIGLRKEKRRAVMAAASHAVSRTSMRRTRQSELSGRRQFCRRVLFNALAGLGLGARSARARSFKMSKETAGYTVRDEGADQICGHCLYFIVPQECMIVEGKVSPYGWCTYYYD
jgi:hypothetical protein